MKKRLIVLPLISLLLVSIAFNVIVLGETKYRITGYVYNKDGTGASGIKIEVIDGDQVEKTVKTDREGKYRLDVELVENQEYQIRLSKDKYQTQLYDFTTPSSSEKEIDLSFTVNKIPIVETNGDYEGSLLDPIIFDSQGTYDPDEDPLEYLWSFGDGEQSIATNPTHTYMSPGEYTITLEVIDVDGATASETARCNIENQQPIVELNGPYETKVGSLVNFDSTGTYDPDGQITTYHWEFDDGTTSPSQNPSHVYNEKGDYTVKLTVSDDFGLEGDETVKCVVIENQSPVADANGPYTGYVGEEILFDGSGTYDPDDIQFNVFWEFGEGSSSDELNLVYVYQVEGTYTVTLTVSDSSGASNIDTTTCTVLPPQPIPPTAEANGPYSGEVGRAVYFSSDGSSDPDSEILEYLWDFGDDEYSTNPTPVHVYTQEGSYSIILSITDGAGLTSTDLTECTVSRHVIRSNLPPLPPNEPPLAEGNGPYSGTTATTIEFYSTGSYDPDGEITQYLWDFGDGTTSSESNTSHVYESIGSYEISLTVSDNQGKTQTYTTLCTIFSPNQPPTSMINGPYLAKVGEEIEFNSNGSNDPDGSITSYQWDYGDGIESTMQNPTHTYQNPRNYSVYLTVVDDKQANHTSNTTVTIIENQLPRPVLEGPTSSEVGQVITFTSSDSYDPDGEITEYLVDFGDDTFTYGTQASHIYSEPGNYTITLTLTDNNQDQQTLSYECTIYENKPPKIITNGPYYASEDEEIEFNPSLYDPDGWVTKVYWSFGDGETSESPNPIHSFENPGKYIIQITLTDNRGKKTTEYTNAIIVQTEAAKFPVITSMVILSIFSTYVLEKKYRFIETLF